MRSNIGLEPHRVILSSLNNNYYNFKEALKALNFECEFSCSLFEAAIVSAPFRLCS
jgi:hypothetical protein